MIKAVILDLNGIFIRSEPLSQRIEAEFKVSAKSFYLCLEEALKPARLPNSLPFFKIIEPCLKNLNFNLSEKEFFDFWFTGERLAPEMIALTKRWQKFGLKVIILSRNFKERTDYYRQNFPELFQYINKVYFSWESGLIKPEANAYLTVLKENNLKPEEVVYFDDKDENIETAKALGLNSFKYKDLADTESKVDNLLK
jgi:putative hydrolase of the HAD superfamily